MPLPAIKLIPMSLIDEPDNAMRIDIPDEDIAERARSIRLVGLIHPIAVTRKDGRYQIQAGHVRFLACKNLGREEIECRDWTDTGVPPEFIKAHENLQRRDPNDAETAEYLKTLVDSGKHDLESLMSLTGKSEDWIAKRLSLFRGSKDVYDALYAGKIGIGQALVLNRFPDQFRAQFLGNAITTGAPVRIIEQWLSEVKAQFPEGSQVQTQPAAPAVPVVIPSMQVEPCILCKESTAHWTLVKVTVHQRCIKDVCESIEAQLARLPQQEGR